MSMKDGAAGFAVIYRWRLKPGSEEAFRAAWETVTRIIRREHGGLGSRLHRTAEGLWLAYAQWPDRASWEALQSAPAADPVASGIMRDCVERRLEPILLEPVADLLVMTSPEVGERDPQDLHDGSA
jgi:quinol monooxygenase YgiN